MKSMVAVSTVVVLFAAQFICETQGLPMRSVTLKESAGMKVKDAKMTGAARWEFVLAEMKKRSGASNGVVGSNQALLREGSAGEICEQPGDCDPGYSCKMPGLIKTRAEGHGNSPNEFQKRCMPDAQPSTEHGT
eukprot:729194_1